MDSTIGSTLIGSGTTLVVGASGFLAGVYARKSTGKESADEQARAAAHELLTAAIGVKNALTVWEQRWRVKQAWIPAWIFSVSQLILGLSEEKPGRGALAGMSSAMAWNRDSQAAQEAVLNGPMARWASAAAVVAMLDHEPLRQASYEMTDALQALVRTYKGGRVDVAAREAAQKALDQAAASLGDAARSGSQPKRKRAKRFRRNRA